ncbi:MAG TPA: PfkB family carbohydrate kinase [Terracidiphilus sp.]|nr:PfkB family carbohydrate kinase [Terracidiphilus sp.]
MNAPGNERAPQVLFCGRTTLDALYVVNAMPAEDSKIFAHGFRIAPGGPACNAAITHALLGGRAPLLSAVGRGPAADLVRAELDRRKIRLIDLAEGTEYEAPLTTVLVNSAGATRTIVNPPAAPLQILPLAGKWPTDWGSRPDLVLTDGFYLRELLPLLTYLRDADCPICFDGGSWKPGTDILAPLLTAAICSERFALPGKPPDAEATLSWFADQGVPYAAVTRGARSILCVDRGHRLEIEVEPVETLDTLGAGDVLHGAFCFYFAAGANFGKSLRRAAAIATRKCRGMGIGAWAEMRMVDGATA